MKPLASNMQSSRYDILFNCFLWIVGTSLYLEAYNSLDPILFSALFLIIGIFILYFFTGDDYSEIKIFVRVFSTGFLAASIAAVYATLFDDPFQNYSDAYMFYELSSGRAKFYDLDRLSSISEGSGAIVIWRYFYIFATYLNLEIGQYIGITVNIIIASFTAVISQKICRQIYGDDKNRLRMLQLMFSSCGMIWLFQANHLRDVWTLLLVTVIVYLWVKYLSVQKFSNLLILTFISLLSTYCFFYLRAEFVFVPLAMMIAGVCALFFSREASQTKKQVAVFVGILGFAVFTLILLVYKEQFFTKLTTGNESYTDFVNSESSSQSLGTALVVNQIIPIRLIVGTIYLFVFPIPVWFGFQLESAYHLFKSLNVIFFYFITPLFYMAFFDFYNDKNKQKSYNMFLLFVFIGFTFSIAATSLESRHFGTFLAPLFVFCLIPDLTNKLTLYKYIRYTMAFLVLISMIHAMWFLIKSY